MSSNPIVKLNVGGKTFVTHRDTLSGSTYFKNLLDSDFKANKYVNDDQIFIDRSSYLFEYVLQYLRLQIITIKKEKLECLKQEAEYFQFKNMVAAVELMQKDISDLEETFEIINLEEYSLPYIRTRNFQELASTNSETYNTELHQVVETFDALESKLVCSFPHSSKPPGNVCKHNQREKAYMDVSTPKVIVRKVDYKYTKYIEKKETKGEAKEE